MALFRSARSSCMVYIEGTSIFVFRKSETSAAPSGASLERNLILRSRSFREGPDFFVPMILAEK